MEKAEVVVVKEVAEESEICVKHYKSSHQILVVGDGDFSFSLSLAHSFRSASNILASSLDSYDTLIKKYKQAKSNLEKLELWGASILHGVDATKMKLHTDLRMRKFDRIIFNFPHAGFHGKEDMIHLIKMHRYLVHEFFRNASGMLRADGEIHVNHKTTPPFSHWNLEELAAQNSLALIDLVDFKIEDYPGYNNKRGAGLRCDEPFPLGECSTFKFRFSPTAKKILKARRNLDTSHQKFQLLQDTPIQTLQPPIPFEFRLHQTNFTACMNNITGYVGTPRYLQDTPIQTLQQPISFESRLPQTNFTTYMNDSPIDVRNECSRIFHEYFDHILETFGRTDCNVYNSAHEALKLGFRRYTEEWGRDLNGYINILQELQRLSVARSAWLRNTLLDLDHQL